VLPRPARAQAYPSRPVRILVGFPPGSAPDLVTRLVGQHLSERLGQPFVVENRPGASSNIATDAVVHAAPDGYTLLVVSLPNVFNATLYDKLNFDFLRDIAPVASLDLQPFVLETHPSVPAKTVPEFIAYARANPGKINMASAGPGSAPHVFGELFKSMAGVDIVHVPFREANSALNAVVSGSVEMMFSIASTAVAQMSGGTVRGIGVTSLTASPLVPGLSSIAQSGLAGFTVIGWNGFVAPKGVSPAIIGKLNAPLQRGLDDPELRQRLAAAGYESATPNSPDDFARFIQSDTAKWIALVKQTNMKSH
jgi:tripartite-type tricarboxylate transporter receptor subunit TctC